MKADTLIVLMCYGVLLSNCQTSIPERLKECYQNGSIEGTQIPTNFRVLIDLIQKAEHYSYTSLDMRTMTSSLLHRFRFDGIEKQEGISISGISPFSGTGSQREKHKIIEEIVPGDYRAFPSEALTLAERCVLHRIISSTIWEHPLAENEKLCNAPMDKISGRSKSDVASICPIETGVVITPYGTIAPGTVLASIAASLQPQTVPVNLLIVEPQMYRQGTMTTEISSLKYDEDEIDLIVPKGQIVVLRSMWFQSLMDSTAKLDNIWVATLAGDIAEMAVYQGPLVGSKMAIGATGFWNSTMQPRIFYLTDHNGHLDATRAEILGGIDGLVIGKNLQTWIDNFNSLRLSQILDMYYSYEGVVFDKNTKVCQRGMNFQQVGPKSIIAEQTHAMAQILAYRNSIAYMTPEALTRMVNYAVETFSTYADNYLFAESRCENFGPRPQLEILVAFDGAWSKDYTADFISVMLEDLDVSLYGSRMGLIHGTTGEWLVNVTHSPTTIYHMLTNFTHTQWPTTLNFTKVLEEINIYLDKTWSKNSEKNVIGHLGQVILLLTPRAVPSNNEFNSTIRIIQQIKAHHPDVRFLYYGSEYYSDSLKQLVLTNEDHLIKSLRIDDMNNYLRGVPRILRPPSNLSLSGVTRNQFEDYVGVNKTITYTLHADWRENTKKLEVTFHGVGYGTIRVCSWNQWTKVGTEDGFYCQELGGHNKIRMTDYSNCHDGNPCPKTHYRVQNVTSMQKCAEMDCKLPTDVRFIIRVENLRYRSAAFSVTSGFKLQILCGILLFFFCFLYE